MMTFLNDKLDWRLRAAFFRAILVTHCLLPTSLPPLAQLDPFISA
jgi:hypothetical protein